MNQASVIFLNGFSPRRGSLGVLAFPDSMPSGTNFTRFFTKNPQDQWFHTDFDFDIKSLTATLSPNRNSWWLLGKNGEVVEIVIGGKTIVSRIEGAGLHTANRRGYLQAITNISDNLFACGYGRQVYQLIDGKWRSIADEILTNEIGIGFYALDGINPSDIYVVGAKGEIFHWNGARWQKNQSPTSTYLAAIRSVSAEEHWICGNNGLVLQGQLDNWKIIDSGGFEENWYSIEKFNGQIYLAGNQSLATVIDDVIHPVDVGLGRKITTHKLHSKEGLLWSIGEKDILTFDGQTWTEIKHPDNTP